MNWDTLANGSSSSVASRSAGETREVAERDVDDFVADLEDPAFR
jgi:hypothetical protein